MKRRSKINLYLKLILCSLVLGISIFQPPIYANLSPNIESEEWQYPQNAPPHDEAALEKIGWLRLYSGYKPIQPSQWSNKANSYHMGKANFEKNATVFASALNRPRNETVFVIGINTSGITIIYGADTAWSDPAQYQHKLNEIFALAASEAEYITIFIADLSGASGEDDSYYLTTSPPASLNKLRLLQWASTD